MFVSKIQTQSSNQSPKMCPAYYYPSPFDFNHIPFGFGSDEKDESMMINASKPDHFFDLNPFAYQNPQPQESDFSFVYDPVHEIGTDPSTQFGNKQIGTDSSSSLRLLNDYGSGLKKLKGGRKVENETETNLERLSTEEIMRVAGEKFVQSSILRDDDSSAATHPYGELFSAVSDDDARDVELAVLLLAAAEKVGYGQFERGSKLLTHCEWIASQKVNTVQKIVSHFAEALRARIGKETGKFCHGSGEATLEKTLPARIGKETGKFCYSSGEAALEKAKNDIAEALPGRIGKETGKFSYSSGSGEAALEKAKNEIAEGLGTNLSSVACHLQTPFTQVMQFAAVQSIIESIGPSTKIHLVDLQIRSGVQWTVFMEALHDRPIQRLTVTAVGTTGNLHALHATGKRLARFAESKNMPFSFKTVTMPKIEDLTREMFEIEETETVAIYGMIILRTLLWKPDCLENLMAVMRSLSPAVMAVIEVEANHNSPLFVERFVEALFFFSAYLDCLEECMEAEDEHRAVIEAVLKDGVRRIVAADGSERTTRSVKVEVWRAFFRRFGMEEIGFSDSARYQAKLVAKRLCRGGACTLEKNGECLVVGWKGTPIHSVSVWRFC